MRLSQNGLNLIKQFEGVRLSCYHLGDGACTVGYGHTRPLSQCPGAGSLRISQAQADQYLRDDVARFENAVSNFFTRNLNQNQFDALVSFAYNLGGGKFANDGWNRNASDAQITGLMIQYVNPKQFRVGLTRRRQAEIALFNSPVAGGGQPQPQHQPPPHTPFANNSLEQMASDVQAGRYGNGEARVAALGNLARGVQTIVNERAGVVSASQSHHILAEETLKGHFGNGNQRVVLLGSYYNAVQAIINAQAGAGGGGGRSYTVRRGDTLSAIAARLGTSVAALVQTNHIQNPDIIVPGQVLYY
ncbi:putative glycoside hydrolase family 25 [Blattamonas nauphoetae]|uniref:Glycoside hydrolase family 25 n=1 Tax=Blattamonas nauphoetae TaxID=2049346 RepID=A0ABQ9XWX6_9EUKA|nr:putative glycoside hydrolase family 25 [Blattamonas nauphoetae]